jgi:two-component system nitrogen regulation sensor histidine kinase NtrY
MKSLRSKIFVFICLLLIFPAIPLSIFIMQLLEKSYRIGVNERVESALDGALKISSDFYQMHREQLQRLVNKIQTNTVQDTETIIEEIIKFNPKIKYYFRPIDDASPGLITYLSIQKFRDENIKNIIWPDGEHTRLYGIILLKNNNILEIEYPLPESFQSAAKSIQEVNQIYKTLAFVQSDIRRSFLFTFLSIYLIGVILALIISYFISKKITRPIEQLVLAADEVGKGNLSYQIPVKGKDEFAVLGSAFNRMVVDLSENQNRIIELEKMASWQQLARKLAHEIKNPLTPIQLMAQQMRDKYMGENKDYEKLLTDCYAIIEEEVESLQRLVREFSDFARLPEFKLLKQDILPLFYSIQKLYNQVNLEIILPRGPFEIKYDFDYLKRVMINLIDNAITAAGDEKPIKISLINTDNKFVQIDVTDQGEGIFTENLSKVFEPYFSTKPSGVGLGLAICKNIIKEHNGKIEVQSELEKGTTFSIYLPK